MKARSSRFGPDAARISLTPLVAALPYISQGYLTTLALRRGSADSTFVAMGAPLGVRTSYTNAGPASSLNPRLAVLLLVPPRAQPRGVAREWVLQERAEGLEAVCGLVAADLTCPQCVLLTLHRDPTFQPSRLLRPSLAAALTSQPVADVYQYAAHAGQAGLVERDADGRAFSAMLGSYVSQRYPGYNATYCVVSTHTLPFQEVTMSTSLFLSFEEAPVRASPGASQHLFL